MHHVSSLTRHGLSMPFKHRLARSRLTFLVIKNTCRAEICRSECENFSSKKVKMVALFVGQFDDFCRLAQPRVLMAIFLSSFFQIWNVRMCLY